MCAAKHEFLFFGLGWSALTWYDAMMKEESFLAVSVGLPVEMFEIEEELRGKGFVQVSVSPNQLTTKEYTRREITKMLDRMQGKASSVIIAWRS